MTLTLAPSGRFKRDLKRAARRGKDLTKLKVVLDMLLAGHPLPPAYRDHPLRGEWLGWRDLHLEPDWLLIYRVTQEQIQLAACGTHADLFDE
ncbi:type II toxin-antitoxin system YafQ family toxin [uncultured Alsobacter sp.]|uniref:type II toxin-antitoxin system YafQ family toxin n=1 Tax=uncultured Alsobacter sp. TaxID=1748258 RepID=UPI0025D94E21|nr:type II toxin-antitoxin system YafQ family toxin [uncultured Alsobacter sp.]